MKKNVLSEYEDDLRPEYDLRSLLKNGVKGKYARQYQEGTSLVLLAPDVAQAFPSEDAVNDALRLVLQLSRLPHRRKRKTIVKKTIEDVKMSIDGQMLEMTPLEEFLALRGTLRDDTAFEQAMDYLDQAWQIWTVPPSV